MPRSGTNFLSDVLHGFQNVASFREIFQPRGVHLYNSNSTNEGENLLQFIRARTGLHAEIRAESLVGYARTKPEEFIDILHEHLKRKVISFKIFPGHLSSANLSSILSRGGTVPIIFWRNPLDTFISRKKAHHTGRNVGVDTTRVAVTLDVQEYANHLEARAKWIEEINRTVGIASVVTYEDFVEQAQRDLTSIRQLFRSLNVPVGRYRPPSRVVERQDRNPNAQAKVKNFEEFQDECERARIPLNSDLVQFSSKTVDL